MVGGKRKFKMNKITARDIQIFVAGALAMWGFGLLSVVPSTILSTWDTGWIGPGICIARSLFGSLGLWLGVAIFFGRTQVVRLAQNFLRLYLILNCCSIGLMFMLMYFVSKKPQFVAIFVANIIGSAALFWLISLSRSPRFQDKSGTQISN
jgi:hypothetical protein